jgi:hypothetical protein
MHVQGMDMALYRNIYKLKKDVFLGVAELSYEILFFTLQLPLSSLFSIKVAVITKYTKHRMDFKICDYLG